MPEDLRRSLAEQTRRFAGLVDRVVPLDITPPAEGFQEPDYGGAALKSALLDVMPSAYRQTFLAAEGPGGLADLYTQQFLSYILSYSVLALSAGAIPVPGVTLLILPTIQKRMVRHLAELHGQPFQAEHFTELAASLRSAAIWWTPSYVRIGQVHSLCRCGHRWGAEPTRRPPGAPERRPVSTTARCKPANLRCPRNYARYYPGATRAWSRKSWKKDASTVAMASG